MKRRLTALIPALLLAALCTALPAPAEETLVPLGDNLSYDRAADCYTYTLLDGQQMTSNVCDGMLMTESVWFEVPQGENLILYRDGLQVDTPDYTAITEPGEYSLANYGNNTLTREITSFTILGDYYSGSEEFIPPSGFIITALTRDGEPAPYWNEYASLEQEGRYAMTLTGMTTGKDTHLTFTVDRTPPTLALAEVTNGKALSAVDISDYDPADTIVITLGSRQIDYEPLLTTGGNYTIRLTDPAGNETDYEFEIIVRYQFNYLTFLLVALAIAVAAAAFLLYSRNSSKIR